MSDIGHPVYDRLEHEIFAGAHTVENAVRDWFHRDQPATETPAQQPATMAAEPAEPEGDPVSLATIAADIKGAVENADQWVKQVTETHLPAILAEASKYENDPIVQALEGVLLPPSVAAGIVSMINKLAEDFPAQVAAPADPAQPVEAPAQ